VTAVSAPVPTEGRDDADPVDWSALSADEALELLYAGHYRSLVRLAVLLVRDVETAEEVVQDAFIAVHGRWDRLRGRDAGDSVLPYLRRSVLNGARSVLRRRGVRERHLETLRSSYAEEGGVGADETLLVTERRRQVLAALRALPERQREVVVLRYYGDLDEASIAAALGISRGAVKSHAHRAVRRLQDLLPPDKPAADPGRSDQEESR
jgi:RNA polymerase sigma-70 factor (sigma-E family)